ncbi:MAG TPA: Rieske (2Fe-2S) protein [Actinomycetota bacterium]
MERNSWTDVAGIDELVDARGIRVGIASDEILLVKSSESVFAIGNECTHQGAGLDKGVVKIAGSVKTVTCPAHGSTFNLETGKVMRPPASKPVPVYDVKIEGGRVFVRPREES